MNDFAQARRTMVDCQVRTFDVTDLSVLSAIDHAPRELFVPPAQVVLAYSDAPITVGAAARSGTDGRVLLPPMVIARLLQALDVKPGEAVLDAGCATGYGTYLLAKLGARVTGLEPDPELAEFARGALKAAGVDAEVVAGPVAAGHAAGAPFDAILLEAGFAVQPTTLLEQLADGGRLVGIDASGPAGKAVLFRRVSGAISRQPLFTCSAPVIEGLEAAPAFVF